MKTATKLTKMVSVPRNQYEAFRKWQVKRLAEEKEADEAIRVYLREKKLVS